MRICLITSSYARFEDDGNARFVRSIAEAQAALGHEVHVLAPYTPQVQPYNSPVHVHWFKYVWPTRWGVMGHAAALENDRNLRGVALWQAPLFVISLLFHLQCLIWRYDFDILHAHWVIPSGVLVSWVARLNRKPFFISLHGSDMYLVQRNKVWRYLARTAFQYAVGVTACSAPLAHASIEVGTPSDRVAVIPYGADPLRFKLTESSIELRELLHIPQEDLIILAVGRLVGKKGFVHLVRAMPKILASVLQARLVIVGEGPERSLLENVSRDLNVDSRVILVGNVQWSQVSSYLFLSDIFVVPSIHDSSGNLDGLPNVVLEAMAAGRPIVATSIGGISIAVENNATGIIVPEADSGALADAIIHLATAPRQRQEMGHLALIRIETELNWTAFARRVDEMYLNCRIE